MTDDRQTAGDKATVEVVRLEKTHKDRAVQALTRAFHDDPMYVAVFPDPAQRERSLRRMWGAVIGYCRVYGETYTTPEVNGAACWLSPENTEITWRRVLRTGMGLQRAVGRFGAQARGRFLEAMAYGDEVHKRVIGGPHWYLWALGVEPDSQGQGIGAALLGPVLACSDQTGAPCYLEALTESNVAFYEKRGFFVAHEGEVPELGCTAWAMVREPD